MGSMPTLLVGRDVTWRANGGCMNGLTSCILDISNGSSEGVAVSLQTDRQFNSSYRVYLLPYGISYYFRQFYPNALGHAGSALCSSISRELLMGLTTDIGLGLTVVAAG
jgi:hypothetical protein